MKKVALVQEIDVQPYACYNAVADNKPHTDVCYSATRRTTSTWTDGVEEDQDVVFTCILVIMWMYFLLILLSHRFCYVVSYKPQQKTENVDDSTGCHRDLMLILIRLLGDDVDRNRLYC